MTTSREQSSKLPSSFDARDWAREFVEMWKRVAPGEFVPDEDWMCTWFANAIMAGYDHARRERAPASPDVLARIGAHEFVFGSDPDLCSLCGENHAASAVSPDVPQPDCEWMSFARGGQGYCLCGKLGSQSDAVPYAVFEAHRQGNLKNPAPVEASPSVGAQISDDAQRDIIYKQIKEFVLKSYPGNWNDARVVDFVLWRRAAASPEASSSAGAQHSESLRVRLVKAVAANPAVDVGSKEIVRDILPIILDWACEERAKWRAAVSPDVLARIDEAKRMRDLAETCMRPMSGDPDDCEFDENQFWDALDTRLAALSDELAKLAVRALTSLPHSVMR